MAKFIPVVSDKRLDKLADIETWKRPTGLDCRMAINMDQMEVVALVLELKMYRTLREGILESSAEASYFLRAKKGEVVYQARIALLKRLQHLRTKVGTEPSNG